MTTPSSPNYKNDVGRLVTDRFAFQKHITGTDFRHNATQIDLSPAITIDGNTVTTVQQAAEALAIITSPPIIQEATTIQKGIVQLSGDIGGISTNVLVTKLQGKPISTITPISGDVLTWDNASSSWTPKPATNAFSAAGDLSGNNTLQQVVGVTGTAGTLRISCNILNFILSATPTITQTTTSIGHAKDLVIAAQSTTAVNSDGGDLILSGGDNGLGGIRGGVHLKMGAGEIRMLQLAELPTDRKIMSLLHNNDLQLADMPANTGDMVIYVRDTITPPTTGNPLNGTIVYSSGGQLWIKQQDGNNFPVGSIPNPSIWGSSDEQTYTYRSAVTSPVGDLASAFSYSLPDGHSVRVDAIFVGKGEGTGDSAQFNLSMGYVREGGAPVAIGTVTNSDPRTTAGDAAGWIVPSFFISGNTLTVYTGASLSIKISWLVVVQLSIVKG
jgi:hypothetical protein